MPNTARRKTNISACFSPAATRALAIPRMSDRGSPRALSDGIGPLIQLHTHRPCANFAVCGNTESQLHLDGKGGVCSFCFHEFWPYGSLTFARHDPPRECPICHDSKPQFIQFPCLGKHGICVACFRSPLTIEFDPKEAPNPHAFGLPKFKRSFTRKRRNHLFRRWMILQDAAFDMYEEALSTYSFEIDARKTACRLSLTRCPMCRGPSPWAPVQEQAP